MPALPYLDFHTHRMLFKDAEVLEIISIHPGRNRDAMLFTMGYHPWWTEQRLSDKAMICLSDAWQQSTDCLALGECGLDSLKGPDLQQQEVIFRQQVELANKLQSPVIIHCVRSFDRLLRIKRELGQTPWAVHGFVRNKVLAGQLLDQGIYLSVAPHANMHVRMQEMLAYIPIDRLFLESDSDYSLSILERYRIFAQLRTMPEEELKVRLLRNAKTFFGSRWKHPIG